MISFKDLDLTGPVALGVGWRDRKTIDGGRIEITNDIAQHFQSVAVSHMESLVSRLPREFSPEVDLEPSEEYLVANVAELHEDEPITNLLDQLELRDPCSIQDLPKRSLLFYAFVFPQIATFLRKVNPYQSAKTGRMWTRLGNTLKEISDPVFVFDNQVDLVITAEKILITNVNAFELLFKEESYFRRHIEEWVAAISEPLPLAAGSRQLLMERCLTNTRLRRRVESIYRRGHLQEVTVSQIQGHAEKHGLDPGFIQNGELDLQMGSIDDVLKLLNEDLFTGDFSGVPFAVDKKSPR